MVVSVINTQFVSSFVASLYQNWVYMKGRPVVLAVILALPILIPIIKYCLDSVYSEAPGYEETISIPPIPHCSVYDKYGTPMEDAKCLSLVYSPNTDEDVNELISHIALESNLDMSVDVRGFESVEALRTYALSPYLMEETDEDQPGAEYTTDFIPIDMGVDVKITRDETERENIRDITYTVFHNETVTYNMWKNRNGKDPLSMKYGKGAFDGSSTQLQQQMNKGIYKMMTDKDINITIDNIKTYNRPVLDKSLSTIDYIILIFIGYMVPVYAAVSVSFFRRDNRVKALEALGISRVCYLMATYCFYLILALIVDFLYIITSAITGSVLVVDTDIFSPLLVICFQSCGALSCWLLVSYVFSNPIAVIVMAAFFIILEVVYVWLATMNGADEAADPSTFMGSTFFGAVDPAFTLLRAFSTFSFVTNIDNTSSGDSGTGGNGSLNVLEKINGGKLNRFFDVTEMSRKCQFTVTDMPHCYRNPDAINWGFSIRDLDYTPLYEELGIVPPSGGGTQANEGERRKFTAKCFSQDCYGYTTTVFPCSAISSSYPEGSTFTLRPLGWSLLIFYLQGLIYGLVLAYVSIVFPEHDRAPGLRFYFLCDKKYYRALKHNKELTDILAKGTFAKTQDHVLIKIRDLRYRYTVGCKRNRELKAINNVSMDIHAGTATGLIGNNGAGKSTLFKLLNGQLSAKTTSGTIEINPTSSEAQKNITIDMLDPYLSTIISGAFAYTPQTNDYVWSGLTVEEHIRMAYLAKRHLYQRLQGTLPAEEFARYAFNRPSAQKKAAEGETGKDGKKESFASVIVRDAIDTIDLSAKAKTKAYKLSGGMQRRLCSAVALMGYPLCVLLDEPTTGLDPQARHVLWETLRRHSRRGTSVIMTSHDMEEVEQLCSDIVMMKSGKVVLEGDVAGLMAREGAQLVRVVATKGDGQEGMSLENLEQISLNAQQNIPVEMLPAKPRGIAGAMQGVGAEGADESESDEVKMREENRNRLNAVVVGVDKEGGVLAVNSNSPALPTFVSQLEANPQVARVVLKQTSLDEIFQTTDRRSTLKAPVVKLRNKKGREKEREKLELKKKKKAEKLEMKEMKRKLKGKPSKTPEQEEEVPDSVDEHSSQSDQQGGEGILPKMFTSQRTGAAPQVIGTDQQNQPAKASHSQPSSSSSSNNSELPLSSPVEQKKHSQHSDNPKGLVYRILRSIGIIRLLVWLHYRVEGTHIWVVLLIRSALPLVIFVLCIAITTCFNLLGEMDAEDNTSYYDNYVLPDCYSCCYGREPRDPENLDPDVVISYCKQHASAKCLSQDYNSNTFHDSVVGLLLGDSYTTTPRQSACIDYMRFYGIPVENGVRQPLATDSSFNYLIDSSETSDPLTLLFFDKEGKTLGKEAIGSLGGKEKEVGPFFTSYDGSTVIEYEDTPDYPLVHPHVDISGGTGGAFRSPSLLEFFPAMDALRSTLTGSDIYDRCREADMRGNYECSTSFYDEFETIYGRSVSEDSIYYAFELFETLLGEESPFATIEEMKESIEDMQKKGLFYFESKGESSIQWAREGFGKVVPLAGVSVDIHEHGSGVEDVISITKQFPSFNFAAESSSLNDSPSPLFRFLKNYYDSYNTDQMERQGFTDNINQYLGSPLHFITDNDIMQRLMVMALRKSVYDKMVSEGVTDEVSLSTAANVNVQVISQPLPYVMNMSEVPDNTMNYVGGMTVWAFVYFGIVCFGIQMQLSMARIGPKHRALLRLNGATMPTHWISLLSYNFVLILIQDFIIILLCSVCKFPVFSNFQNVPNVGEAEYIGLSVLMCLAGNVAVMGFSSLVSIIPTKTSGGRMIIYIVVSMLMFVVPLALCIPLLFSLFSTESRGSIESIESGWLLFFFPVVAFGNLLWASAIGTEGWGSYSTGVIRAGKELVLPPANRLSLKSLGNGSDACRLYYFTLFGGIFYLALAIFIDVSVEHKIFAKLWILIKKSCGANKKKGSEVAAANTNEGEKVEGGGDDIELNASDPRDSVEDEVVVPSSSHDGQDMGGVPPVLSVSHLVKRYGSFKALNDVSFSVFKPGIYTLIGENGAGKSTLINCIVQITTPTSGSVHSGGVELFGPRGSFVTRDIHKYVSLCPQEDVFWPRLTVKEHFVLMSRLRGMTDKGAEEEMKHIAEIIDVDNKLRVKARDLSGGMKRRLCLGMSMMGSPNITITDEPTTGLDPITRRHVWKAFGQIGAIRPFFFSTHSMVEAEVVSDKVMILDKGRLLFNGSKDRLEHLIDKEYLVTFDFGEPTTEVRRQDMLRTLKQGFDIWNNTEVLKSSEYVMQLKLCNEGVTPSRLFEALANLAKIYTEISFKVQGRRFVDIFSKLIPNNSSYNYKVESEGDGNAANIPIDVGAVQGAGFFDISNDE